jgi:hypothetical protein
MRRLLSVALLAGAMLVAIPPAEAGELNALFDLSFRVGDGGVTLGGRVDGPLGPTSATITGRLQRGGVAVDGWLDDRGQTWTFELDANVLDGVMRAIVRRPPQRI